MTDKAVSTATQQRPLRKCYLAGPMRGIPEFNFPAFFAAAKALRARGIEVWSPAENDVHQDGFDPAKDAAAPMRHYMKRDLPAVLDADFVAVLPGWQNSKGAMCEVTVARACDIPVLNADDLTPASETKAGTGETPRTDAKILVNHRTPGGNDVVHADFARQLERDLNEARVLLANQAQAVIAMNQSPSSAVEAPNTTERAQSAPKPPAEDRGSCWSELRGRPSQEGASTQAPHSQAGGRVETPASIQSSTRAPTDE